MNYLIVNARSFSSEGSSVRVTLRPRRGPTRAQALAGYEIIVDDDGPGIPADAFERIFERFYTDRPDHGFGQNSGLGLSISRQIVEVHGGTIVAANRMAEAAEATVAEAIADDEDDEETVLGARFTVWLPASCDVA